MRKYQNHIIFILSFALIISIISNIYVIIKNNKKIEKYINNNIIEILQCASETQDLLQDLIDGNKSSTEKNSLLTIGMQFDTISHLCHANRYIIDDAHSDFQIISSTFLGKTSATFVTDGIYDDLKITDNEIAYFIELIKILEILDENVAVSNIKYDLDAFNSNLETIHVLLENREDSPFLLIEKEQNSN